MLSLSLCLFFCSRSLCDCIGNNSDSAIGFDFPALGTLQRNGLWVSVEGAEHNPVERTSASRLFKSRLASTAQTAVRAGKSRSPRGVWLGHCATPSPFAAWDVCTAPAGPMCTSLPSRATAQGEVSVYRLGMHVEIWDLRAHTYDLDPFSLSIFLNSPGGKFSCEGLRLSSACPSVRPVVPRVGIKGAIAAPFTLVVVLGNSAGEITVGGVGRVYFLIHIKYMNIKFIWIHPMYHQR